MLAVNRFALKEWAAVCAALAQGRQSILLRKGGIEETGDGFRVEHDEFWLYPTRFHQSPDELTPDSSGLLDDSLVQAPPEGVVRLRLYAVVDEVFRLGDAEQLGALDGMHVLSPATILKRFEYRRPGLNVLLVRIYHRVEPFEIAESPHFAGCKSWVDLRNKLPTSGLSAVLSDSDFNEVAATVQSSLH